MQEHSSYDAKLRSHFSVGFRIILVIFSCYLLAYSKNEFHWSVYAGLIMVYLLSFYYLKKNNKSLLRLFNDFAFISLVIYGKTVDNPIALLFILLPIINAPNHSGDRGSPFILTSLTFALLIYLMRDSDYFQYEGLNFYVFLAMPVILVTAIISFESWRTHYLRFNDKFMDQIEAFYAGQLNTRQEPYKILKALVRIINTSNGLPFKAEMLLCFRVEKERLTLLSSSKPVLKYSIANKKDWLNALRSRVETMNGSINIDGKSYRMIYSELINTYQSEYLYILLSNTIAVLNYRSTLRTVLTRLTNIVVFEESLNDYKAKYLDKLKNKIEFIDDAQMSMHFIKNKLGPIDNFIEMCKDLETEPPSKEVWEEYFLREARKAQGNITLITKKAESFHKEVEGIFSFSEYERVSILNLLTLLRRSWFAYFSDETLTIELKTSSGYLIEINDDLLEILFNDWISNMHKYHKSLHSAVVSENQENIFVVFTNDFDKHDLEAAKLFVKDFKSDGRSEIIRRSATQGLLEIRYLSKEMDLNVDIDVKDHTIEFKIVFPKK